MRGFQNLNCRNDRLKLNNNKATGEDDIPGELLKYSPKEVKQYIAQMINDMFRKHEPLKMVI